MEDFDKIIASLRICAGPNCDGCMCRDNDECTCILTKKAAEAIQHLIDWHKTDQDLIKELRKQVDRRADELKALTDELATLRCQHAILKDEAECQRRDNEKLKAAHDAMKWCVKTMCGGGGNAES